MAYILTPRNNIEVAYGPPRTKLEVSYAISPRNMLEVSYAYSLPCYISMWIRIMASTIEIEFPKLAQGEFKSSSAASLIKSMLPFLASSGRV